jgi:hypothetical protein
MLHVQAYGVQNIRSLISTILDPSSTGYALWRDQVLFTLKRYELTTTSSLMLLHQQPCLGLHGDRRSILDLWHDYC